MAFPRFPRAGDNPRTLPAAFADAAARLDPAVVETHALDLARQMNPLARYDAGDEAICLARSEATRPGRSEACAVTLSRLHRALRLAQASPRSRREGWRGSCLSA